MAQEKIWNSHGGKRWKQRGIFELPRWDLKKSYRGNQFGAKSPGENAQVNVVNTRWKNPGEYNKHQVKNYSYSYMKDPHQYFIDMEVTVSDIKDYFRSD